MAAEKTSPGQRLHTNPLITQSGTVNDVLDLVNRFKAGGLQGLGRTKQPGELGTDLVMVQNLSGADRERGDVLQLGEYLLDDDDLYNLWFKADTPADPIWKCVILQRPAEVDAIVPAHCSGVCVAKVDVLDDAHTHAIPVVGDYLLQSAERGPIELLSPAVGGEHLMAVRFSRDQLLKGILDQDLGNISPVNVSIWKFNSSSGVEEYTGRKIVARPWMLTAGEEIEQGTMVVLALIDHQWYVINAGCVSGAPT